MKPHRLLLLCLLLSARICAADAPDTGPDKERIMEAFNLMEAADQARDAGTHNEALQSYGKALDAYMQLAREYPNWQANLVRFRIAYCRDQLKVLLGLGAAPEDNATPPTPIPTDIAATSSPPHLAETPDPLPTVAAPGSTSAGTNGLDHITAAAKTLLANGEFVKARLILMEGMGIDPDHYLVRLLLGVAQCEAGRFDDAALLLKQLAEENPSDPNVHVALAGAYIGMGESLDARKEVATAIKLKPGMPEAHYNMAQILISLKPPDTQLARYHYGKALELGAKPDEKMEALLAPDEEGQQDNRTTGPQDDPSSPDTQPE